MEPNFTAPRNKLWGVGGEEKEGGEIGDGHALRVTDRHIR